MKTYHHRIIQGAASDDKLRVQMIRGERVEIEAFPSEAHGLTFHCAALTREQFEQMVSWVRAEFTACAAPVAYWN